MFTCGSCLRRRAFSSPAGLDLQPAQFDLLLASVSKRFASPSYADTSVRNHATVASIQKGHHRRLLRLALQSGKEIPLKRSEYLNGPSALTRRNIRARLANKHHLDIEKEDDPGAPMMKYPSNKALAAELRWTGGDALKLAKSVLTKLKAGDPQSALEMVRLSEKMPVAGGDKGVDSVVSWNHVMDYFMSKGSTREAFKVFNEMKKRGHKPDAHTYTIMLRGYTMNHQRPNAVEEAMKVYDSMWRPESNIRPSIIHSNAIINCLGRALNMDALWSVAGRLPDRGAGAPDKWTYTTILNTMQACAVRDARQLAETDGDLDSAAKVVQNAIGEGRRLWEDIVGRWRSGDVSIDETLVCAMGRLLLLGQSDDWNDIFSLVEQTMRLPRLTGSPARRVNEGGEGRLESAPGHSSPEEYGGQSGVGHLEHLEQAVATEAAAAGAKNEFAIVDLSDRPVRATSDGKMPSPYANVGNNVLSLLLEAAIKLRALPAGKLYWAKLTNPDNEPFVMPDVDNIHSYLRLLRISRSSKAVCDLLRRPVNGAVEGIWYRRGTFVIAMSTCARDFKNPNAFTYASTILDLMQDKLEEPDAKVMTNYLSLAMVTTPGISTELRGDFNASAGENNLIRAIQRFNYSGLDYRTMVNRWTSLHGREHDPIDLGRKRSERGKEKQEAPPPPEDLLEFMRTLHGAYDKLLHHRLKMTAQMATAFTIQKSELSKALHALNPKALPPSRADTDRKEPADALREQDRALKAKRYPDKLARRHGQKVKGPRVVDLDKRHPFLTRGRESEAGKRGRETDRKPSSSVDFEGYERSPQSPESSPLSEGWSKAWKKSVQGMGEDEGRKDWVAV